MNRMGAAFVVGFAVSAVGMGPSVEAGEVRVSATACSRQGGTLNLFGGNLSNSSSTERMIFNCPIHDTNFFPHSGLKRVVFSLYDGNHTTGTSVIASPYYQIPHGSIGVTVCAITVTGGQTCSAMVTSDVTSRGDVTLTVVPPTGLQATDYLVGYVNLPKIGAHTSEFRGMYLADF
jgi:hypothetical protein